MFGANVYKTKGRNNYEIREKIYRKRIEKLMS